MEIKLYFTITVKRLWIRILIPIIAGSIAAFFSFYVMKPVYEANTTLFVINKQVLNQSPSGYNDLITGQLTIKDYRELIRSRSVTASVIEQLNIKNNTSEVLAKKISVNSKNDSRIIEIVVQDENPENARDIANKVGDIFIQKATALMKVNSVEIVDKAQLPNLPVKSKPFINIAFAILIGILISVGITFLKEYMDDTIKTVEEVEKHLGLPVLGTIPSLNMK